MDFQRYQICYNSQSEKVYAVICSMDSSDVDDVDEYIEQIKSIFEEKYQNTVVSMDGMWLVPFVNGETRSSIVFGLFGDEIRIIASNDEFKKSSATGIKRKRDLDAL